MLRTQKLHTFARRTCGARFTLWADRYAAVQAAGRGRVLGDYSEEEYSIFPRYNLASAVGDRVETYDPENLPNFNELKAALAQCVSTALAADPATNETEKRAREDEAACIQALFAEVCDAELDLQSPLPYRRVLRPEEVQAWSAAITRSWGAKADAYWYPLGEKTHPSLVGLVFPETYMAAEWGLTEVDKDDLQSRFLDFFERSGVRRLIALRELGPSVEIEAASACPDYDGDGEGFWTSASEDWIVYCSHEQTVTLGGSIASILD